MNQPIELSLEQEFSIICFADQVQHMSHKQVQELLLMLHKEMMIREKMYQEFLKHEWRLDAGAGSV